MSHANLGNVDMVARLLQDPRVQATINLQSARGNTALQCACMIDNEASSTSIFHLLLQAGANPALTNEDKRTPLVYVRDEHPLRHAAIALLEQAPDAEKASLIVKARRLAVATISNVTAPSCQQSRVARGEPLPRVALTPVTDVSNDDDDGEAGRKFSTMMAFVLGMKGGPKNAGMPRDVFRVILDLLMPSWDPLRRRAGAGVQVQE